MNCEDVRKFSFAYLDCEFDDRDKVEFEAHLAMCGDCRGAVELDARFRSTVRQHLATAPCDPEVKARIQARIASARRSARLSRTVGVPLALAASVALAFVSYQGLIQSKAPAPGAPSGSVGVVAPNSAPPAMIAPAPSAPAQGAIPDPGHPAVHAAAAATSAPKVIAARRLPASRPARPAARVADSGIRLAAARRAPAKANVRGANLAAAVRSGDGAWPMPSVRRPDSLRALVNAHAQPLPDEIAGDARRIQRYLQARMPGIGAPPLDDGTGVHLVGARFTRVGGHSAVLYRYRAFGKHLTAIRFVQAAGHAAFDEPDAAPSPGQPGSAYAGVVSDTVAGFSILHILRSGERFALVGELDSSAMRALLEPAG